MSYCYEDTEYADYGNHDDGYDEYDAYSDYAEPDHHEYEDDDTQYHEDTPEGLDHGHEEPGYEGDEVQELEELTHNEDGTDWEERYKGYKGYEGDEETTRELEELEYTANGEVHEPEQPEYEGDEVREYGELAYELEHDTETSYTGHEPYGFKHDDEQPGKHTHLHLYHYSTPPAPVAFDNTPTTLDGAYGPTPIADDPFAYAYPPPLPPPSTHGDHAPTYVPPIPPFSLTPTPRARDAPHPNQQSHVTASKHAYVSDNGRDDDEPRGFERDGVHEHEGSVHHNMRTTDGAFPRPQLVYHKESGEYVHPCFLAPTQIPHHHNNPNPPPPSPTHNPPSPSPRNYSDINVLLQDIRDGDSEAIAYMAELNRYTEECGRIEMERQINGDDEYGEKDSGTGPQQNHETKDPENGATPTEPPLVNTPTSPPPPPPTILNNNTPTHTTPYLTSRLCPQPWPNKKYNKYHFGTHTPAGTTTKRRPQPWPNKKRNKHHYGTRTPAGTTTKRRPPPWPILPTPTPIFSIENSRPPPWPNIRHRRRKKHSPVSATPPARPPPWPIISHRSHPTLQNRRNAKRRIKAQSRSISDEVSF
jgi:hypothetical protein